MIKMLQNVKKKVQQGHGHWSKGLCLNRIMKKGGFVLGSILSGAFTKVFFFLSECNQHDVVLKELEEQLAEQKKLLQSVASRGEEILIQQASPSSARYLSDATLIRLCFNKLITDVFVLCSTTEPFSPAALSESRRDQMRQRWESLRLELKTKLQLLQKTLEQDQKQPVMHVFFIIITVHTWM